MSSLDARLIFASFCAWSGFTAYGKDQQLAGLVRDVFCQQLLSETPCSHLSDGLVSVRLRARYAAHPSSVCSVCVEERARARERERERERESQSPTAHNFASLRHHFINPTKPDPLFDRIPTEPNDLFATIHLYSTHLMSVGSASPSFHLPQPAQKLGPGLKIQRFGFRISGFGFRV
jgi:hypothetical protein